MVRRDSRGPPLSPEHALSPWEHADVFPVIARIIDAQCVSSDAGYVTHDQLTSALLADAEGSALIVSARDKLDEERTAEWIAHNMVAWFSQRITVGDSDWAERFDREKSGGKWAYRPRASGV